MNINITLESQWHVFIIRTLNKKYAAKGAPSRLTMAFNIKRSRTAPIVEGDDIAITLFCGTDPSTLMMRALNEWLGSQGASTRGNKAALVERYVSRLADDVRRLVP